MARHRIVSESMVSLMRVLAINGPATKYSLANRLGGKQKRGLTGFAYATVHKYIVFLSEVGYVRKFGYQKKPIGKRGKRSSKTSAWTIKHKDVFLYGLSFHGLAFAFMADPKVRDNWERVKENYEDARINVWFSLAKDWTSDPELKVFPLRTEYTLAKRHYELSPSLFVHSIVFSQGVNFKVGLKEFVKLAQKYKERKVATGMWHVLKRETNNYREMWERCKRLEKRLNSLRRNELILSWNQTNVQRSF